MKKDKLNQKTEEEEGKTEHENETKKTHEPKPRSAARNQIRPAKPT
jgi:hypothetical protein